MFFFRKIFTTALLKNSLRGEHILFILFTNTTRKGNLSVFFVNQTEQSYNSLPPEWQNYKLQYKSTPPPPPSTLGHQKVCRVICCM